MILTQFRFSLMEDLTSKISLLVDLMNKIIKEQGISILLFTSWPDKEKNIGYDILLHSIFP